MIPSLLLALFATSAINGALAAPASDGIDELTTTESALSERGIATAKYYPISTNRDGIVYSTVNHQGATKRSEEASRLDERQVDASKYYPIKSTKDGTVYSNVKPQGSAKRSESDGAQVFSIDQDGDGKTVYGSAEPVHDLDAREDAINLPSMGTLCTCMYAYYAARFSGTTTTTQDVVAGLAYCVAMGESTDGFSHAWQTSYGYAWPPGWHTFPAKLN